MTRRPSKVVEVAKAPAKPKKQPAKRPRKKKVKSDATAG